MLSQFKFCCEFSLWDPDINRDRGRLNQRNRTFFFGSGQSWLSLGVTAMATGRWSGEDAHGAAERPAGAWCSRGGILINGCLGHPPHLRPPRGGGGGRRTSYPGLGRAPLAGTCQGPGGGHRDRSRRVSKLPGWSVKPWKSAPLCDRRQNKPVVNACSVRDATGRSFPEGSFPQQSWAISVITHGRELDAKAQRRGIAHA